MFEFNATFLIAMISFVVFIIIMNAILYKPILSIIAQRQNYIDDNNSAAQNSKKQAQSILDDREQQINNAFAKSKEIVSSRVLKENETAKNLTDKAKAESMNSINAGKAILQKEELETSNALKTNVKELAEKISSKILGENITIDNVDYNYIDKVLK